MNGRTIAAHRRRIRLTVETYDVVLNKEQQVLTKKKS